ncbi:helix-hairpin-helix domain-containing protein [Paenibacillus pini]|uniref:DNA-binding protein n=1 Tax=Paenibacillus pini JCM 16418 TaxID=1236976 RepID=W7Y6S2_9BACL|nr:hypothetical protein [Paenibacillus pini]GAF06610.1 hypothetical protein JCM16418_579 [Paenibacillus pini JCM 16418]
MKNDQIQECNLPTGLAKPAIRALNNAGLCKMEQIAMLSEAELRQLHGIGPNAIKQIRTALEEKGLKFSEGKTKI